jgi:DNA ligase-1
VKRFTDLYSALDETNKTNEKVSALRAYFATVDAGDAAWAIYFLTGRKPKAVLQTPKLTAWAIEEAGISSWLFNESYDAVGDLAETIALLLPEAVATTDLSLKEWVEDRLLNLKNLPEEEQKRRLRKYWQELSERQRYVFNKLLTGAFRVGVSQQLVTRALSLYSGVDAPIIAHRLMGSWQPTAQFFESLISKDTVDADHSRPYPFFLAYPLEQALCDLGEIEEWQIEWKWDGIRAQVIRRDGEIFIWSRGEELVTDRYPELLDAAKRLPNGTAIDGEILAWKNFRVLPFTQLQLRIGRKVVSQKLLEEVPVILMAYDLLEVESEDIRTKTMLERRELLAKVLGDCAALPYKVEAAQLSSTVQLKLVLGGEEKPIALVNESDPPTQVEFLSGDRLAALSEDHLALEINSRNFPLRLSPVVGVESWQELEMKRDLARELSVEGVMLKRRSSPYRVGRQRGDWWKWKVNPFTIDAVLIYAQRGSGKRASLYTDYTFGVWDKGRLVPIAKAYSGLTDEEIRRVDNFVRQNTTEKFGPVRTVKPKLVFELGFEAIQRSSRHRSGIAVRFPRMLRWRTDKPVEEADSIDAIVSMLPEING